MQTTSCVRVIISFQIERPGLLVAGKGLTADLQPLSTVSLCRSTRSPAPGDSARACPRPAAPSPCSPPVPPPPPTSPLWHLIEVDTAAAVIYRAPEVAMITFGRFVVYRIPSVDPTGRPAASRLFRRAAGREWKGGGRKKWARRRRATNRLVREGASRASKALSFGGSTSFRGAPLQATVRCQCGDVSSSVCWTSGRTNRSNWGHVRHWKKRICGRCEIWSGTTAPAITSLVL